MIYGSVCSGIEAATVAWEPLGWHPAFFSEIEPFPKAVLAHRWPSVPDLGDFTKIGVEHGPIDLLVGGTPCQAFSIAGLRGGLADTRGNLALEFCRLAARLQPRWIVWENVPGVLSSGRGRDFGSFLGALAKLGYGWAYRILDAQYFGVAQRRRRVFVVGHLGDRARAAAVLFEPEGMRRDPPPDSTPGAETSRLHDTSPPNNRLVVTMSGKDCAPTLCRQMANATGNIQDYATLAIHITQDPIYGEVSPALSVGSKSGNAVCGVFSNYRIRRFTPREFERLQGFPDDHTLVPWRRGLASDGPRYRALGNSMAVPVMRWIGERIDLVETFG